VIALGIDLDHDRIVISEINNLWADDHLGPDPVHEFIAGPGVIQLPWNPAAIMAVGLRARVLIPLRNKEKAVTPSCAPPSRAMRQRGSGVGGSVLLRQPAASRASTSSVETIALQAAPGCAR
jgi:hypothetical protein